jgi:hypothetical protein
VDGGVVVLAPSDGVVVPGAAVVVGVWSEAAGRLVAVVVDGLAKGSEVSPLPQAAATSARALMRMVSLRMVWER